MENALIEATYASLDQANIKPLTDQLKLVTGHTRSIYCEYNVGDTHPYRFDATGISDDEYEPYFRHYHKENLWLKARMFETSQSCFFLGSNAVSETQLKQSAWYNEFMRPRDMADMVSFGCRSVGGKHSYLNLLSSTASPEFSEHSLKLMRAATPHINRMLNARRRLMDMSLEALFYSDVSTSRQQAHFLVDSQGRILLKTPIAEDLVELNDGFSMSGGHFVFDNQSDEQGFDRAIRQTFKAMTLSTEMPRPLRVEQKSSASAFVFDFCPWTVHANSLLPSDTYILVTVFAPSKRVALRPELIQTAYKLTHSETRLAVDLVDGIDLKTISESRELSLATLRNHLKSIFAKTGIHRQGELISDMARFLAE